MATNTKKGFTLIEVMVSVSIFSMVMLVATGAVFSIVSANKKTHSLKSVMTNLNFALESMMREIRLGSRYSCGSTVPFSSTRDCQSGDVLFSFKANRDIGTVDPAPGYSVSDSVHDEIQYSLNASGNIVKTISDGSSLAITADEVHITSLKFYVIGSAAGDGKQPKVTMSIQGYSGSDVTQSNFNIETTVSQRSIDS